MQKRKVTGWIVVANEEECRILTRNASTGYIDILQVFTSENSRLLDREIGADKPGRVFESVGGMRHGMEPRESFHKQFYYKFAHKIAQFLNQAAANDQFHALTLAASPPFLGSLRSELDKNVEERIVIQIAKDLTHIPAQELPSYIHKKAG